MERDKIKDTVVKMVDGLIGEVLAERKSEFDAMKAVVKRKKKSFQNQRKLIVDATNYSVSPVEVTHTVDVTPKGGFSKERLIKRKGKKK